MISLNVFIPQRFESQVRTHLVLNYAENDHYPLILGIFGSPGTGKTFQLRTILTRLGVGIESISAADLESERAGEPGKLIATCYLKAAREICKGNPRAIVIDDFDTTIGEWQHNTGTVNHQQVVAQIMHLADNPNSLEKLDSPIRRVPIFITGNDFSKLYSPLRRPGRMFQFYWRPNLDETMEIVGSILSFLPSNTQKKLVELYMDVPISFFSEVRIRLLREACAKILVSIGDDLQKVVEDPLRYKKYMLASFESSYFDEDRVIDVAREIIDSSRAADRSHLRVYGNK